MRVVIAEDSALLREGLRRLLTARDIDVVGETGDGDTLVSLAERHRPDAVLTDLRMPPGYVDDGLTAIATIRRQRPEVAGLLLSQYADSAVAARLLDSADSGVGYLLKERITDPDQVCDALVRVCNGEVVVDPDLVRQMLGRRRVASPLETLTEREHDVLALMAEGLSNIGISERLFLSPKTVERYSAQVFDKLGLHGTPEGNLRVRAVLAYLRSG